jgi:hypothetical protein
LQQSGAAAWQWHSARGVEWFARAH